MLSVPGLLFSILTAVVIAQGLLGVGGLLVLFVEIFDMFDGAMARIRNAATNFGAFFDLTLDLLGKYYPAGIALVCFATARPA